MRGAVECRAYTEYRVRQNNQSTHAKMMTSYCGYLFTDDDMRRHMRHLIEHPDGRVVTWCMDSVKTRREGK